VDPGFSSTYNLSVCCLGFFLGWGREGWQGVARIGELQIVTYCSIQHNDNNDYYSAAPFSSTPLLHAFLLCIVLNIFLNL
jgi:hypothetical protein